MDKSFLSYFLNELKTIFGIDVITLEDIEVRLESTAGWNKALMNTCTEFGFLDEYEWYKKLDWDASDEFDYEIGEKMYSILKLVAN